MSMLFAFFHHVLAFTLVSAIAIEFILLGQDLSHATAKRLVITDAILGVAAGLLLVVGLCRVFFFEKGAGLLLPQPRLPHQVLGIHRRRADFDYPDRGIFEMAQSPQGRAIAGSERR